jgi:hypothetical protein
LGWNFDAPHNSKIIWDNLLNQSSDWSGTLFGLHDWADRPPKEGGINDWKNRKLNEPGTVLNIMMYVLTCSPILYCKWRKPLPVILKEKLWTPLVLRLPGVGMDMKTRL